VTVDRQIDQMCPHIVTEEALYVASDRRTVRPFRPISSSTSVKVLLNNTLEVPFDGVNISAGVTGVRKGPFTVSQSVNDTLVFSVNQGPTQTISLPTSYKMAAEQCVGRLNRQASGVTFSVVNNSIRIDTRDKGPEASLFIGPTSLAGQLFGLTPNREYRGQRTVPGWSLVADPATLADRPTRLIVFDTPLRSGSDFVEISYATIREECRRCGGTGVENDWRYDVNGEQLFVQDEGLLIQEMQKLFFTLQGSNPFHTWYGTGLVDSVGKKITSGGFVQNLIVSDVHQAFNRWQSVKRQQEGDRVGQIVSDREFPYRLLSVNLEQSVRDPTVIFINCVIQNRSNSPIQLTRGIRVQSPTLIG
jgi:hypothetical protein